MLSREDRILSELIVSRGLATPEAVERRAGELENSSEHGLVQALISHGELDPETGREVREEARAIDGLLCPELPAGKTLGEYRLVREIGRGGMGIVYEAVQTSLGRRVALKVLPAGAALDERLAVRFLREARAVSRLRHPGIVPVFGTGHEQGVLFFAMELIEGESLAERLERGPIPAGDAARIAGEIARALQHAHEAGLVHRDVKPENVMIGTDERTRLGDFGLVHDVQGARLTRSQYVLGTPAYSAPEQARGEPVDPRSDVYGAGAVLYAMLSGRPPFTGEVPAAVVGRLINESPPPLISVARGAPSRLVTICERAMARDPTKRFPTAGAFAEALDRFLDGADPVPEARDRPTALRTGRPRVRLVLAVGTLAAAAGWFGLRESGTGKDTAAPGVGEPAPRIEAGLLEGTYHRWPESPGWKFHPVLSPDGQTLLFSVGPGLSDWATWLQGIDEAEPRLLAPASDPQYAHAWSPDGRRLAYCRSQLLEIVELASGTVDATGLACQGKMSWSPDGTRLVTSHREWPMTRLSSVDLRSRTTQLISSPGTQQPAWSAQDRIAYVALRDGQHDVWTCRPDGSDARRVTDDASMENDPVWSRVPGRLHYASNRDERFDLWRVDLDTHSGEVLSGPTRISNGWLGSAITLTAARNRDRLAFVHDRHVPLFWLLSLDGQAEPIGPPSRLTIDLPFDAGLPERAPDRDEWVVAARRGEALHLHRIGVEGGDLQVTDGSHRDRSPRWSPDGSRIAFDSDRSGGSEIWIVNADGSGLAQMTYGSGNARFPVWSPDGREIAYSIVGQGPWVVAIDAREARALEIEDEFEGFEPWSWSADGKRIAGTAGGIVIHDLERRTTTRVTEFGERPSWIGRTDALLFSHASSIFRWDGTNEPRAIGSTEPNLLTSSLSLGSDGREVVYRTESAKEQVWFVDLDSSSGLTE